MPSGLMDSAAIPSDSPLSIVSSTQSKPSGCWGKVSFSVGDVLSLGLVWSGDDADSSFPVDTTLLLSGDRGVVYDDESRMSFMSTFGSRSAKAVSSLRILSSAAVRFLRIERFIINRECTVDTKTKNQAPTVGSRVFSQPLSCICIFCPVAGKERMMDVLLNTACGYYRFLQNRYREVYPEFSCSAFIALCRI